MKFARAAWNAEMRFARIEFWQLRHFSSITRGPLDVKLRILIARSDTARNLGDKTEAVLHFAGAPMGDAKGARAATPRDPTVGQDSRK